MTYCTPQSRQSYTARHFSEEGPRPGAPFYPCLGPSAASLSLALKNPVSSSSITNRRNDGVADSNFTPATASPVHLLIIIVRVLACGDPLPTAASLELKERININTPLPVSSLFRMFIKQNEDRRCRLDDMIQKVIVELTCAA
jgi:hypothetical protein